MSYKQRRRLRSNAHQLRLPGKKPKNPKFQGECRYCGNLQGYGTEGSMACMVPDRDKKPDKSCYTPSDGM